MGPDRLDDCIECQNNTMGAQCDKCKPFFVGDPTNNGECVSCNEFCYGHSDLCVSKRLFDKTKNASRSELERDLVEGPYYDPICLFCANKTEGTRCESCVSGHFRGSTTITEACRPCECNGHGDTCDPSEFLKKLVKICFFIFFFISVTGEKCNCSNNTESDNTCSAKFSVKNSIFLCWMSQCNKCRESYSGHPKSGHQCYKHITIDSKMCLDAKSLDECKTKPQPLKAGQTVFFVVQPRFMNVDIRIIMDVTQGELDFFMSSQDDSFVVFNNKSNGGHEIYLDNKYQYVQDITEMDFIENLNISPMLNKKANNYENLSTAAHSFNEGRHNGNVDCRSTEKGFFVQDKQADGLSTFVTLNQCLTLVRVFGVKNRLVVTLPQDVHNLSGTRFFIAIRAAQSQPATYGLLFFRQDQLHIDLFVFFSVFFSCFFLFLAVCVVSWKAKQAADLQRARRLAVVEMLHMAQRPFSVIMLDVSPDTSEPTGSRWRPSSSKSKKHDTKLQSHRLIALEPLADDNAAVCTIFVRLPGKNKSPVCSLAIASALIVNNPRVNLFSNRLQHRQNQQQQLF